MTEKLHIKLNKIIKLLFVLMGLAQFNNSVYSQDKLEREFRIKEENVPEQAKQFIKSLDLSKRIKWFREEGLEKSTIEAKTKHLGKKYSIEFNIDGQIEDVEIRMDWLSIPKATRSAITKYLNSEYQKFRFKEIQIQYTGSPDMLIKFINKSVLNPSLVIKYEIVTSTKNGKQHDLVEYLFNDVGEIERRSLIILSNTDHLEY